eukprot:TRINITY_DN61_c0_g1_i5.p1 TRINITY_DN61_c0_g1~~TRINITY_DN61_c0_g1_i5.p1  ORF type:complete len:349 (+),score=57.78 TRINITY_DN61_c0_g1_i5:72-1118(+)
MQDHYFQYQDAMSIVEDEYKPIYRPGCADRFAQNLLPDFEFCDAKTKLNAHMGLFDGYMVDQENLNLKAALNSAYENMLVKSLRMAFLAGQEAGTLQNQVKMDERLVENLERRKWCTSRGEINSTEMEDKYKVPERQVLQGGASRKRRLCRHFLKGHCKRGKTCDFLHDASIFCEEEQKIFLGGLPAHITKATLRLRMAEQGFEVINSPKVLRGFTPQVCLASVDQAQKLIKLGRITIDGTEVDVRPYRPYNVVGRKQVPDAVSRSVFLGGLACGTTRHMIKDEVEKLGVKVVNHPLVKMGFSPQVMLGTLEQAQKLIRMKQIVINETLVDVRPYIDDRRVVTETAKN